MILRRMYSVPEHITMAGLGAGLVGSLYPDDHGAHRRPGHPVSPAHAHRRAVPVLRTYYRDGRADPWSMGDRSRTSPLAYLVAGLVVGTTPVLAARAAGAAQTAPRQWSAAARKRTRYAVLAIVALSWVFQLHRYGFL